MARADIDWGNLGFTYRALPERYVSNYADGAWDAGGLTSDARVALSECAGILHYCQEVFEGLKAYETVDGHIVTFRPDLNAARMYASAAYLEMPSFPEERFIEAVDAVVTANRDYVPPYGSDASLYLRPLIFATGEVIGVKPADAYQFRLFATPVGPYFKGGAKPVRICVSDFDRAAPHGTGHIKAGLNYAMSLHAYMTAKAAGFDENMFLDAATRTYVEETGGANFLFVTKDGTVVKVGFDPAVNHAPFSRLYRRTHPRYEGGGASHRVRGASGVCRVRPVRNRCGDLTRRLSDAQGRGDRIPERHGAHGTCPAEAL